VELSKHFKRFNLAQKKFELHARVKKCHFWQFFRKGAVLRKVVIEEWLAVSSSLVGSTASHPTYYNFP
jgi:hypothetical protein